MVTYLVIADKYLLSRWGRNRNCERILHLTYQMFACLLMNVYMYILTGRIILFRSHIITWMPDMHIYTCTSNMFTNHSYKYTLEMHIYIIIHFRICKFKYDITLYEQCIAYLFDKRVDQYYAYRSLCVLNEQESA